MNQTPERQSATGLEFLRNAMAAGGLGKGIGQTLGLSIDAVDDGQVTLSGAPGLEHANPMGAVHGGYLATLLDGAMALAVQTQLDIGTRYATTDLNITYVKGVAPGQAVVRCVGAVLHLGRTMALAEAKVVDDAGKLYAHATATFAIADRHP
ncbi:PaaI family thioesterase [Stenotrophomonas sp.]|uniref:PaaI family thioesterase n=1 Tax=Stenotrophomonas sp. TaxID=69392 RepID=UPI00289F6257|nr:PaaI family thioesterase [Stenotrophomonas sp.]